MPSDPTLAVAFPLHEGDRARVRAILNGHPLPAIYPHSEAHPCTDCGLTLAVGPRVAGVLRTTETRLLCPFCMAKRVAAEGGRFKTRSLGNPDSKLEDE